MSPRRKYKTIERVYRNYEKWWDAEAALERVGGMPLKKAAQQRKKWQKELKWLMMQDKLEAYRAAADYATNPYYRNDDIYEDGTWLARRNGDAYERWAHRHPIWKV